MTTRFKITAWCALAVLLLILPSFADTFFLVQIAIKSLWLGMAAASLTFLIKYGGMVSLAQTAIYGTAGYVLASLNVDHHINPVAAALLGVVAATVIAFVVGLIAARTYEIYFLMLTLAVGVFLYYFALEYQPFTHGHSGLSGVELPSVGSLSFATPVNFYYLALGCAATALAVLTLFTHTPIGLALQGVRDAPARMEALGFHGKRIRIIAFTFAGSVAGLAGVLSVWYNGQIAPGSVDVTRTIDVLVAAVVGGLLRVEGAWIGALAVTLLSTYASDYTARYNSVIGAIFILVVLFSPQGIVGLAERAASLKHVVSKHSSPVPADASV